MRLFLLALVLTVALWWAVATSGGRYQAPPKRSKPRVPHMPTTAKPKPVNYDGASRTVTVEEVILIDDASREDQTADPIDEEWPDIIDA